MSEHSYASITRQYLDDVDGLWEPAREKLARHLSRCRSCTADNVYFGTLEKVKEQSRASRSLAGQVTETLQDVSKTRGLQVAVRFGSYLKFPLAGGIPLGDAVADDLRRQIDFHSAMEAGNARQKRWHEKILKRLPDDETPVGKVLTEQELADLHEEASHV